MEIAKSYNQIGEVRTILALSQKETFPYEVTIAGHHFAVLPNVFSPKYFFDTALFAENIDILPEEKVLEVGSGTGVLSVIAALKGASKVIATDINPDAVMNTDFNARKHDVTETIETRLGDCYLPIDIREKFDCIICNTPFTFTESANLSLLENAVFDTNYSFLRKLLVETPKHLSLSGRLILGFSATLGRKDLLDSLVQSSGLKMRQIYSSNPTQTLLPENNIVFELFEIKPNT